jgi:hypothetical protein
LATVLRNFRSKVHDFIQTNLLTGRRYRKQIKKKLMCLPYKHPTPNQTTTEFLRVPRNGRGRGEKGKENCVLRSVYYCSPSPMVGHETTLNSADHC